VNVVAAGHRLEYEWIGPKPDDATTLVFLHAGLGSVSSWRGYPAEIARATECSALVYSRAGYGRSDPIIPPRPLSYMHHEGEVVLPEVLDALHVRDAILVGHSDGGSIAIVHAGTGRSHPRVRGLILEAAHVFCEDLSVASIEKDREEFLHGDLRARLVKHHGENAEGAFWGWNRAWLDPKFREWNLEDYAAKVTVPTLVIQGEDDPYGTIAQVDSIERHVKGPVTRLMLPRCAHAPHRDAKEATRKAMIDFVLKVRSA